MSEIIEDWDKVKKDWASSALFRTNFGYSGRELELAISMFNLGFNNGFDDLKKIFLSLTKKLESAEKVVEFYSNDKNWIAEDCGLGLIATINDEDVEGTSFATFVGGKKARDYFKDKSDDTKIKNHKGIWGQSPSHNKEQK